MSERTGLEEELKHQAFHDALSGLANRALFRDRLEHALARATRSKSSLAVLFLDLDDFKLINDSLGHTAGDALLVAVAGRLSASLRSGDTAARFGGDEFAVLVEETTGPEEACQAAERLIAALCAPLVIEDHQIQVRASVGSALSQAGHEDPTELMQAADVAMYAAKARGKGRYEVYQPDLQAAIVRRLDRTADLQRAIEGREFVVHYQPIVSLDGGNTVGLEALVRWRHPENGLLLPEEFIALAAEAGLSLTHMALAFVITHPGVSAALIGPRTMEQLDDLLTAAQVTLSDDLLDRIDAIVAPGTGVGRMDQEYNTPPIGSAQLRRRPVPDRSAE